MKGFPSDAVGRLCRLEPPIVAEHVPFGLCRLGDVLSELLARYELTTDSEPEMVDLWPCEQFASDSCEMATV